jgi:RHS repeat-associated protein
VEAKDGQTVIGIYEYDAVHRRIKCHLDSQAPDNPNGIDTYVHYFHNSAWQVLETRDTTTESAPPENLQPAWQYVWSPRYVDGPVLRDRNTDADGLCDDERLYYLNDANFNVTTLVDTGGDAVERYLYEPYGKVTMYDGSWTSTRSASRYANVVMYTGRESDSETDLYYYRARYYKSGFGRFVTRDPISVWIGVNSIPYGYSAGNPTVYTDPSGLCVECCCCAERISLDPGTVTTNHRYIPQEAFGHYFELVVNLALKISKDGKVGRCGVEFWENSDAVPPGSKCAPNEWCDGAKGFDLERIFGFGIDMCGKVGTPPPLPNYEKTLTQWCRFFHPDYFGKLSCPSQHTVRLVDAPATVRGSGAKRRLFFHVQITSAKNCDCGDSKKVVWEGCQFLEMDAAGRVTKRELHSSKDKCPGFPLFSPPAQMRR